MADLTDRILASDVTLTVADIVDVELLDAFADPLREVIEAGFLPLGIVWGPDRSWGEEFRWGEKSITLGHKRGHHIASHPELLGYEEDDAAEILRLEVEGTLWHELGHALLAAALESEFDGAVAKAVREAIRADGPVTSYVGHDGDDTPSSEGAVSRRHSGGRAASRGGAGVGGSRKRAADLALPEHEQFAEAFRWWMTGEEFGEEFPEWDSAIGTVLAAAESQLVE